MVLDEGPSDGINDSTSAGEKHLVLPLVNQIQTFAEICYHIWWLSSSVFRNIA